MPTSYFWVFKPANPWYIGPGGAPLPESDFRIEFVGDAEHAHAVLFERGFMIPYEDNIFDNDKVKFKSVEYQTGREGIPNLLGALTKNANPYIRIEILNNLNVSLMRFGKLIIDRHIQPGTGGKRKKRATRRNKKQQRKSRRH